MLPEVMLHNPVHQSLFKLIPDFKESTDADRSDDIHFKLSSIKADWEEEA